MFPSFGESERSVPCVQTPVESSPYSYTLFFPRYVLFIYPMNIYIYIYIYIPDSHFLSGLQNKVFFLALSHNSVRAICSVHRRFTKCLRIHCDCFHCLISTLHSPAASSLLGITKVYSQPPLLKRPQYSRKQLLINHYY